MIEDDSEYEITNYCVFLKLDPESKKYKNSDSMNFVHMYLFPTFQFGYNLKMSIVVSRQGRRSKSYCPITVFPIAGL